MLEGLESDGLSYGHTEVYLWAECGPHIYEVTREGQAKHRQIESRLGVHTSHIRQEVTAVPMSANAAATPSRPVGSPALEMVRRYFGSKSRAFEVARNIHPVE